MPAVCLNKLVGEPMKFLSSLYFVLDLKIIFFKPNCLTTFIENQFASISHPFLLFQNQFPSGFSHLCVVSVLVDFSSWTILLGNGHH